jgi:hypothetical protein
MEVVHKVFKNVSKLDVFRLYPLGDLHAGSIHCDEDLFHRTVMEIKNYQQAIWVGMGDMADAVTVSDKRWDNAGIADWVERDNIIESQRKMIVEWLSDIKDKGVAYLTGNHEETIHAAQQNNLSMNIARDLGIPYGGYHSFILLDFERKGSTDTARIVVHAWHGAGAAQMPGARVSRLMSLVGSFEADIHLMGHLHAISTYTTSKLSVNNVLKIRAKKVAAVCTGSWLKAYEQGTGVSYVECKGYKPSELGCPMIEITPFKREFQIKI